MDGDQGRGRLSSFVLGGVVGASAALAAARRRRGRSARERRAPQGLQAFEGAPCFREVVEREQALEEARFGDQ
jgi:gas vesicle protein